MTVTGVTSPEFLGWLAGTAMLYRVVPVRWRAFVPTAATAGFLALIDLQSLMLLSAMACIVGAVARSRGRWRSPSLLGGVCLIVLVLVGFKVMAPSAGMSSLQNSVLIPLGISFYSFRCVHVLLELYLDEIHDLPPATLLHYLFFLPVIAAGPIHRYPAFAAEEPAALPWATVSEGLERILYGYAKVIVISNYLISIKLFPWVMNDLTTDGALYQYLDCVKIGLNIYFQFAGYSDIAIGFALLLGHRVMENFDNPLIRTNIAAFWRSWHISLSSWCREYVFAGTYAVSRQRWLGILATMLAIGLWHGITWNYLAWGLYHGCGILVWQQSQKLKLFERIGLKKLAPAEHLLGWFLTFNFVMLGFALTKESDLLASLDVFRTIFQGVLSGV